MITLKPFRIEDVKDLNERQEERGLAQFVKEKDMASLVGNPNSFSIWSDDRVVGCAGVFEVWPGRAEAWAFFDESTSQCFLGVHRVVKDFLDGCSVQRLDAQVQVQFEKGNRWMRLLGFELFAENVPRWFPNGAAANFYQRVR